MPTEAPPFINRILLTEAKKRFRVQAVTKTGKYLEFEVISDHYSHAIESYQRQMAKGTEILGCYLDWNSLYEE